MVDTAKAKANHFAIGFPCRHSDTASASPRKFQRTSSERCRFHSRPNPLPLHQPSPPPIAPTPPRNLHHAPHALPRPPCQHAPLRLLSPLPLCPPRLPTLPMMKLLTPSSLLTISRPISQVERTQTMGGERGSANWHQPLPPESAVPLGKNKKEQQATYVSPLPSLRPPSFEIIK